MLAQAVGCFNSESTLGPLLVQFLGPVCVQLLVARSDAMLNHGLIWTARTGSNLV